MSQAKKYNEFLDKKNKELGTSFRHVMPHEDIDFSDIVQTAVSIAKIEMMNSLPEILKPITDRLDGKGKSV